MTQEEKLLLADLSARLSYGVILNCCGDIGEKLISITSNGLINNDYYIEEVKPYLFPMSSMTDEHRNIYHDLCCIADDGFGDAMFVDTIDSINWCYENHYDINGLIPKGLAINAIGLNIY